MVGIVIGLFVVAAASYVVATQLGDNRRLLLEVQVQQDLRAAADIITRELRRAGSWDDAQTGIAFDAGSPSLNPLRGVTPSTSGTSSTAVEYQSSRAAGTTGPYSFSLTSVSTPAGPVGVIESRLETSTGPQALTDAVTMSIERFRITAQNEPALTIPCPKRCADGSTACWPTTTVRSFIVELTGRSTSDPAVVRSVRSAVRLRNDQVLFNDPLNPSRACPA